MSSSLKTSSESNTSSKAQTTREDEAASETPLDQASLQRGVDALSAGGVIAYPTEAVWGLGCDPFNEKAVMKLLEIKNRPVEKGLILIAASLDQLPELAESLTTEQLKTVSATWPGPVTWLLPDPQQCIPRWIKGEHPSVAVRVSAHPLVRALCEQYGGALVSTSANDAGEPEIRSQSRLEQEFGDRIDAVISGELGSSAEPSQIRDLLSGARLR